MSADVALQAPNVLAEPPPVCALPTERRLFDRENGEGSYWMPLFLDFLARIKIVSKELTEPAPIDPYGAQIRFLDELCEGLDSGVHMFVCLKARQLGISTIMLALDLFWLWMFPGLQGALIADTAENKDTFKQTIEIMLEGLPDGFKIPVKRHNRNGLLLKNGSRLMYMSAGRRKNSGLGRSRGLNFVHATECSSWGDQKGLDSLLAALAADNPHRLYIFESTALGYNLFFEMCETAKAKLLEQRFMFIGWWAKEIYRFVVGTAKYDEYWGKNPELTPDEQKTQIAVLQQYGHAISTEQWAWYRAKAAETSEASLREEYPSTEGEAFQSTGNAFFSTQKTTSYVAFINSSAIIPRHYSVHLGDTFTRMGVSDAEPGRADLLIWEEPNQRGRYVMGVDPATGEAEGDDPDRTVISIWRGYADKTVQVAEYATTSPTSQQCCWVMAYLAAVYRDCIINVEKNGPGLAVMAELKTLRQMISFGELRSTVVSLGRTNILDGLRWFLYHRADSMGGDYLYNFTSNPKTKIEILNSLRDAFDTDRLIPRSVPLLREMSTLTQHGKKIQGSGRNKDDRVFAAALAQKAWSEWLRPTLMAEKRTFEAENIAENALQTVKTGDDGLARPVVDHIIKGFFHQQALARATAHRDNLFKVNY